MRSAILTAAQRAAALTYPAEAWVREAPFALAYKRRVLTDRGLVNCWEPQQFPNRQPGIPDDVTCSVLLFKQKGGPRSYVLWSVGAHATVLGKTSRLVSADYPGLACDLIEESIPGARSLFLMGASGETQPWIATREDPEQLRQQLDGELVLATISNGSQGYFPAEADFQNGGYEVEAALHQDVQPGDGEALVSRLVQLAESL
ncbi:MAG: hypothetical protein ACP5I4_00850 [Oceanipulchritudo sp.]